MTESNDNGKAQVSFHKFEVPFDLDSIFTLQYNVQGLKSVLEFILEHLGELKTKNLDFAAGIAK